MKYDAEERDLPATRDHIARTVRDKFPAMAAANAVPTMRSCRVGRWRSTGAPTEELEALHARFGAEPARLRTETLRNVLRA